MWGNLVHFPKTIEKLVETRRTVSLVSSSPGLGDAVPAFLLRGASCCQFAADGHRELDPVLSHLPQLTGEVGHLRTGASRFILDGFAGANKSRRKNPLVWKS